MATKFQEKWERTKKEYESLVGKKPNSKVLNLFRIRHTGISKSLEKGYLASKAATDSAIDGDLAKATKGLKDARAAHKTYLGVKATYLKDLEKAIQETNAKTATDVNVVQVKGLKFLAKELTAIGSEWDDELGMVEGLIKTNAQVQQNAQMLVAGWSKAIRAGLDRALAEIAKVKAKPTVETYNALIFKAARNFVTELTRARDFKGIRIHIKKLEPRLQAYAKDSNKYPASLPDTAKTAQVVKELKTFSDLVKEIDAVVKLAATLGK